MRQLKHGDKIRFIVETEHFKKGFETVVIEGVKFHASGLHAEISNIMICGLDAGVQYLHGEHWEFVD